MMVSFRLGNRLVAMAISVGLTFIASSLQAQHHGGHGGGGHRGGSHHSGMGGGGHHHHHSSFGGYGGYGGFGNSGLSIGLGYGGLGYGGLGYGNSYGLGRSYYSSRPSISVYASPSYSYPVPGFSYSSQATVPSLTYTQRSTYSPHSNQGPGSDLRPGMVLPDGAVVVSVEPIK